MKKIKILIIIIIVIAGSRLFDIFSCWTQYTGLSIDERIEKTLAKEPFSVVEFEDGYICLYSGMIGNEECLYFTYLKRDLLSDTGLNLRALIADSYGYYLSNSSMTRCFELALNNFSKYTIYFSCCEEENAELVTVNGKEVEMYDIEIVQGSEVHQRKFWFYMGKDGMLPMVNAIVKE